MITREDIQSFLDRLDGGGLTVMEIEPNLWLARTPDDAEVVVHFAPPVVILRVRVMELPASEPRRSELFRQLLEYNARELVHGSYGLEGDHGPSPARDQPAGHGGDDQQHDQPAEQPLQRDVVQEDHAAAFRARTDSRARWRNASFVSSGWSRNGVPNVIRLKMGTGKRWPLGRMRFRFSR